MRGLYVLCVALSSFTNFPEILTCLLDNSYKLLHAGEVRKHGQIKVNMKQNACSPYTFNVCTALNLTYLPTRSCYTPCHSTFTKCDTKMNVVWLKNECYVTQKHVTQNQILHIKRVCIYRPYQLFYYVIQ